MHARHHSAGRGAALLALVALGLAACANPQAAKLPDHLTDIGVPERPDPPGLLGILIDRSPPPVTVRAIGPYGNPLAEAVSTPITPDIADQMIGPSLLASLSADARFHLAGASVRAVSAPTGTAVAWESLDGQGLPTAGGSVVPARNIYLSHRGVPCRDLQQHVQTPDGGATEQVTLCRNDMGDNRVLWLPGSPTEADRLTIGQRRRCAAASGGAYTPRMETVWGWLLVPLAVLGGTAWLGGVVLDWLKKRAILDHPVERSSHQIPVPRGGGLALVPLVLFAWAMLAAAGYTPAGTAGIVVIAAALAALSWQDDRGGLSVGWRLLAHLAAACAGIWFLPATPVFQGLLPPLVDQTATVLLWVWFLNLYNFMDGIDAITCTETICLALGIVLVACLGDAIDDDAAMLAWTVAAGALGFLRWNRPPAQLFLGDVGSVPLGFLLGWLLLAMAAKGHWVPALILPLYYLADATITLARRVARGERFWQAHRQHFYQRALTADGSHGAVVRLILGGNIALILLAGLSVYWPLPALALAVVATGILLVQLARRARAHLWP